MSLIHKSTIHVLVIGGFPEINLLLAEKADRVSLIVIKGINDAYENFEPFYKVHIYREMPSSEDLLSYVKYVHQQCAISAIAAFSESTEKWAAEIAASLGINFHSKETIENVHDKVKMRLALNRFGVDRIENTIVESEEDVINFIQVCGLPIILKPVNGRGSSGIAKIENISQIADSLEWSRKSSWGSTLIAEKFVMGEEYSVEAFSENGNHKVIAVTQKYKEYQHFIETGHCMPADIDSETSSKINEFVASVLKALGIRDGPTHTEIMVNGQDLHVIETHTRLGGDNIRLLVRNTYGINMEELWCRQVIGEQLFTEIEAKLSEGPYCSTAIWFKISEKEGKVLKINGLHTAKNIAEVIGVDIYKKIGSSISNTTDSSSRLLSVMAKGRTNDNAIATARKASENIIVLMEEI